MNSVSEISVLPPKPHYVGFSDSADICTGRKRPIRTNSDIRTAQPRGSEKRVLRCAPRLTVGGAHV
jgi:hypothetical protein